MPGQVQLKPQPHAGPVGPRGCSILGEGLHPILFEEALGIALARRLPESDGDGGDLLELAVALQNVLQGLGHFHPLARRRQRMRPAQIIGRLAAFVDIAMAYIAKAIALAEDAEGAPIALVESARRVGIASALLACRQNRCTRDCPGASSIWS